MSNARVNTAACHRAKRALFALSQTFGRSGKGPRLRIDSTPMPLITETGTTRCQRHRGAGFAKPRAAFPLGIEERQLRAYLRKLGVHRRGTAAPGSCTEAPQATQEATYSSARPQSPCHRWAACQGPPSERRPAALSLRGWRPRAGVPGPRRSPRFPPAAPSGRWPSRR